MCVLEIVKNCNRVITSEREKERETDTNKQKNRQMEFVYTEFCPIYFIVKHLKVYAKCEIEFSALKNSNKTKKLAILFKKYL